MDKLFVLALFAVTAIVFVGCEDPANGCDELAVFSYQAPAVQYYSAPVVQQQVMTYAAPVVAQPQVVVQRQRVFVQRQKVVQAQVVSPVVVRQRTIVRPRFGLFLH